jgi:hypothetical protein
MVETVPKVRKAPIKPAGVSLGDAPPAEDAPVENPRAEEPIVIAKEPVAAQPLVVNTVAVGGLTRGSIFEINGERFIKVIPVQRGKEIGQRLIWHTGAWERGSAVSFDPDTQVKLIQGGN